MGKKITRQDVAREAGVSGATVSRVYNLPHSVNPLTRTRVKDTAQRLGFVPDKRAASLRSGTPSTILFVEWEGRSDYEWPREQVYTSIFGAIIRALMQEAQDLGFPFELCVLRDPAELTELAKREDVGGILGFNIEYQADADAILRLERPCVVTHHTAHLHSIPTVATDNRGGGKLIAEELGRRKVGAAAYVNGLSAEVRAHADREFGFCEAFRGTVLNYDRNLGLQGGFDAGRDLAPAIRSGLIEAIVCVNDLTLAGVLRGLNAEGVYPPYPCELAGHDNLPLMSAFVPNFISVDSCLPEIYIKAFRKLIAIINGDDYEVQTLVRGKLITSGESKK